MKPVRQLKLDITELESVFDSLAEFGTDSIWMDGEHHDYFLDPRTGSLVTPDRAEQADEWLVEGIMLPLPHDLFEGLDHGTLDEFVASLPDGSERDELARAIRGKGAFRRFKDIVFGGGNVELQHRWNWHETRRKRERITEWLEQEAIIPDCGCDIFEPPPLPDKRPDLLRAVLDFTRNARTIPGVLRISLIGSLVTRKAVPKDVDLLVEVRDDLPLEGLARLRRRLSGATMSTGNGCGADVFLNNPRGEYLGRICAWKQCAPGIRQSCEARNYGRRGFLCDDLDVIRLDPALIAAPPLELWPEVVARTDIPNDVRDGLVTPLQ